MAENDAFPDIEPAKQAVAELHAEGRSVQSIVSILGETHGISERTVYRWLAEPQVCQVIRAIQRACIGAVSGKLHHRLERAMDRLDLLIDSEDPRVAAAAVRMAADITLKLKAFQEYDLRLAVVEATLQLASAGKAVVV